MTHNAFRFLCLPALLAAGLLSGCSNQAACGDAHPYLGNRERPPLEAPAGASVAAPDPAYVIPGAQASATQTGGCMIRPPDVLGALGAPAAASVAAPTITRHRHGKAIQETKPGQTPAPAAASQVPPTGTRVAPAVATRPPME